MGEKKVYKLFEKCLFQGLQKKQKKQAIWNGTGEGAYNKTWMTIW